MFKFTIYIFVYRLSIIYTPVVQWVGFQRSYVLRVKFSWVTYLDKSPNLLHSVLLWMVWRVNVQWLFTIDISGINSSGGSSSSKYIYSRTLWLPLEPSMGTYLHYSCDFIHSDLIVWWISSRCSIRTRSNVSTFLSP